MARTTVDQATEKLAFAIASGAHPAASKLPSVRTLARDLGINASTVQVVLGQLQAHGFVESHQSVGFLVRDIHLYGGIDTWRYLFRFSQQLPDMATRMLVDILATRLVLVGQAVRAIARDPQSHDSTPVHRAVDQLELLVASGIGDKTRFAHAELHAVRMTVAAARQGLSLAVFNSVGQIFTEVPDVLAAMNEDRDVHVAFWKSFLDLWDTATLTDKGIDTVEAAIQEWDKATVARFANLLAR